MPETIAMARVYDFSNVFERALAQLLTAAGVNAYTSQFVPSTGDDAADAALGAAGFQIIEFQKSRPRAEITFSPGAGQGRFRPVRIAGTKVPLETAWKGQYMVRAVTKADIREHNEFLVTLRFLLFTMANRMNGTEPLTRHALAPFVRDGGSSPTLAPETGVLQTNLSFDIDFSVQDNAWSDLES